MLIIGKNLSDVKLPESAKYINIEASVNSKKHDVVLLAV